MVLDRALPASGYDQNVVGSGGHRLLDNILDDRSIHYRKHLLRLTFCRGKEPGSQSGGGNDHLHESLREIFRLRRERAVPAPSPTSVRPARRAITGSRALRRSTNRGCFITRL